MASTSATKSNDLTAQLVPHLDRQLVLPLLDFLESQGSYSHEEVLKAKYDLLKPTNMVTYVLGLKREIDGTPDDAEVPAGKLDKWDRGACWPGRQPYNSVLTRTIIFHHPEFASREQTVVATLKELEAQAGAIMDVISSPEVVSALRQDKLHNLTYLKDNHNVRTNRTRHSPHP